MYYRLTDFPKRQVSYHFNYILKLCANLSNYFDTTFARKCDKDKKSEKIHICRFM